MARKGKKDESDDEQPVAAAAAAAPPARGKGKKGGKRGGDVSDDEPEVPKKAAAAPAAAKKGGKKGKNADDSEEEEKPVAKKGGKKGKNADDSEEDEKPVAKKGGKKGKSADDSDEDEKPAAKPKPAAAAPARKQRGKRRGGKGGDSDDDDDDVPSMLAPVAAAKGKPTENDSDDEDIDDDEPLHPLNVKTGKAHAWEALEVEDEDDDEEEDEEEEEEEKEEDEEDGVSSVTDAVAKLHVQSRPSGVPHDAMAHSSSDVFAAASDDEDASATGAKVDRKEARRAKKQRMKDATILSRQEGDLIEAKAEVDVLEEPIDDLAAPQGNDIKVNKFSIFAGGKALFKNANLTLAHGRRYGLVGYNGTGKTTLLRHLYAREGDFKVPRHIDIHMVEQEAKADDKSALITVVEADEVRLRLLKEEALISAMSAEDQTANSDRLVRIYEKLEEIGASAAIPRASAILSGLQFTEEMKQMPTRAFSGGWRMRIALARALFRRPRLLLLDEPTNHLDLHAVIWLENYLESWPNTLVVVSHDRQFLTTVCTDMLQVWQQSVVHYKGNYEAFEKQFKTRLESDKEAYEKQQKKLKALKKSGKLTVDITKGGPQESATKRKQRDLVADKRKGGSRSARDDDEDAASSSEVLLQPVYDYVVNLKFSSAGELKGQLLRVEGVDFGYGNGAPTLFEGIDFGINFSSRIAVVGPNGTGKSTLLKLCSKEVEPVVGHVHHHGNLRIGVYSQHSVDQLDLTKTPVQYLMDKFPVKYEEARKLLGTIGLPGHIHEHRIGTLSGGQKSRVVLVELQLTKAHILLLDEPTNHLDLETVDGLIQALNEFDGGIMIVTHNVNLIEEVCNEIWICGEDKTVEPFKGDFSDYVEMLVEEMKEKEAL